MIITCHFLLYTNFRNRLVDNVLCTALVALCTVIWRHKVNKLYTYWKFIAVKYMIILKEVETVMVNNSGWVRLEVATDFLLLNQIHTFVGGKYIVSRNFVLTIIYYFHWSYSQCFISSLKNINRGIEFKVLW